MLAQPCFRIRVLCALVCAVLIACCNQAFAQARSTTNVVVVLAIEGGMEVSRAGSPDWDPAYTNQVLRAGDRLRTGPRSRATLRLYDLSVVRVDERSFFQIEAPPEPDRPILVHLIRGVLYLFHRDKPGSVRFRSGTTSAATRGTEFNVAVDETSGRMTLTIFEGEAELRNEAGAVVLSSGEQGIAEPGKRPFKTAVINAANVIQWCLYYPGVLDANETGLSDAEREQLDESLAAYRSGDLLQALARYPENRQPVSAAEKLYLSALLLAVGQVSQAEALLHSLADEPGQDEARARWNRLADALRLVVATVKGEPVPRAIVQASQTKLATECLAESYHRQSHAQLPEALRAARMAVRVSSDFGFAGARVAELEFSFGRTANALEALDRSLTLSPRNAQAVALRGFLLAAQNQIGEALAAFDQAIHIDGALANAWLGRGLCKIRQGHAAAGREDLQVAATLEPNRALLRSYLGKAFSNEGDTGRAFHELALARGLDRHDPTAWLYSALLHQQRNRINEAIEDLERSVELNKHRRVYRSHLLLDQDRAVRGANLANIYRDAGMVDVSVREAARAVNADYANYSAHWFLAGSYNELRDPNQVDLRYETAWFSEYLLANLLAPVGAGTLSQLVSQHEYSRLLERDRLGLVSSTDYFSNGDWVQGASQYGTLGNTGYALDVYYRGQNGQRVNNDQEQLTLSLQLKQQLGLRDGLFLQSIYYNAKGGDLSHYFGPASANPRFRFKETQEPILLAGWHHEWSPEHHTLLLASRLDDTFRFSNPTQPELVLFTFGGQVAQVPAPAYAQTTNRYQNEFEAYSAELQHIWRTERNSVIAGGRYQWGQVETDVRRMSNAMPFTVLDAAGFPILVPPVPSALQSLDAEFDRASVYGYFNWQVLEPLQLSVGLSYDRLRYPVNFGIPPVTDDTDTTDQLSPKAGFTWRPGARTTLRGGYTRSLGGVSLDQSFRLEPTQVAGFNQAFRSLMPESAVGNVPAAEFETFGLAFEHQFKTRTYLGVEGELLRSEADRVIGAIDLTTITLIPLMFQFAPGSTRQRLDFTEQSLRLTLNQLVGDEWSLGARYRLSGAELETRFRDIPSAAVTGDNLSVRSDLEAVLHQLDLFARFYHPSGFFGEFDALWAMQSNHGYSPGLPGEDFWQFNVFVGYRFPRRRAEVRVGVLNLTDQDYRLNPLNLTAELPRERTFAASLRFNF